MNKIFNKEEIPKEYLVWLKDLVPFVNQCLSNIDIKLFNKDQNHEARLLLAFFVVGVVNYYKDARELTYGQHRYLTVKVLEHAGWEPDMSSTLFDISSEISNYLPELTECTEDSLDAGYRSGKHFFENGDERAFLMPKFKSLQWKKDGWLNT